VEEFPIFKDGVEVGEVLIREVGHDNLGYIEWHIEEAERGKGLAAPAVERVIRLAFESGRYHRLVWPRRRGCDSRAPPFDHG
jgi:RimJ/RimL family protein N-acetyltransferase